MKAGFPIFIIMIIACCTSHRSKDAGNKDLVKPYPHIIDMSEGFQNTTQLKLSAIADSIRYVVLSKNKQELIGGVSKIQIVVSMAPSITFFDKRIVLMPAGDAIYEIDSKSISKGYIIDWGNIPHKQSNKELYFRQASSSNKASIGSLILETCYRTYLRVSKSNEYYLVEYNKITGSTKSMILDPDHFGFINDLDGGANYFPYYTNREGDIWIIDEDAYNFKENHSPEFLEKSMLSILKEKEN